MYFNGTKCRLLIISCLMSGSLFARDVKSINAMGLQKPLCFVENKGQVTDDKDHPRKDIQFKLSTPGLNLFVGNGQLHYQFKKVDNSGDQPIISTYRMDVTLLGANTQAKVSATEKLDYYENYMMPHLGANGVTANTYSKVTYANVYPNIDWVIYVKNDKVEYDFVVRPGGNPADIQLSYGGATALSITADGGILAKTPMGDVTEHQPVAYETVTGKAVASRFNLHNNVVSFATGSYKGSLTIDPYLQWSTYFGGTLEDKATAVKVNSTSTGVYVCGYTSSTSGISTGAGIYQSTYGTGAYDAFLARYNATGTITWATYFGGTGDDRALGITTDPTNIYITGSTTSTTGISSAGPAFGGATDGFIAKFTATGGRTWGAYMGGTGNDYGNAITIDGAGALYVAGQTYSATGIATAGAYQTGLSGTADGFLIKYANTGVKTWGTYFGGSAQESAYGVAADASNNISITGQTNSIVGITNGAAYQSSLHGTNDAFAAHFSSAGVIQWSTYFGGSGTDQGNGIATDASGNIYITGTTTSADSISSGLSYQNTFGGGSSDAFLVQFSSAGAVNWGTYFGGSGNDMGQAVATDLYGNIDITGATYSTTGIATAQGYQTTLGGNDDAYIGKFNVYGQNIYGSYFGKNFDDYGNAIATDPASGAIVLAGYTTSTIGLTGSAAGSNVQQASFAGGISDAFITKFQKDTLVKINQPYVDTLVCPGGTLSVAYTTNSNFAAGNTFTVQLSDASGSFATPVNIGSVTAATSGTVTCTIPAGTPAGTGYRIRIKSSAPSFTSPDNIVNIQVVAALPGATVTGTTPVCVGATIALYAAAPYAITSYSWTGPSGFTSAVQSPIVTNSAATINAGVYSVSTTHNGCPAVVSTISIAVSTFIPPSPIDSASTPICAGSDLYLFTQPGMTGTFTYSWTGPNGFTSTDQNPVIAGASTLAAGTYYAVDTLAGCPSSATSINVVVNTTDTPNITVHVTPGDTICTGTLASFTTTVVNGGVSPAYQWMNGSLPITGAIFSTYSSAYLSSSAQIYCILTNDISCPDKPTDTSNVIDMTVIDNTPIVHIVAIPDTFVTSGTTVYFNGYVGGSNITGYQWYLNGVAVPGDTTASFMLPNVTSTDTVKLQVTTSSACANTGVSNIIIVRIGTLGVANVSPSFSDVQLFPNPNYGSFAVKGSLAGIKDGTVHMDITNALGQVIYTTTAAIDNGQVNHAIDLKNIPSGMYILHMDKGGEGKVIRFMVD